MRKSIKLFVDKIEEWHRTQKAWYRVASFLSCFVVFVTVYALILPAITLITDDGDIDITLASEYNEVNDNYVLENISLTFTASKDYTYTLQYSSDDGQTWTDTSIISEKLKKNMSYVFSGSALENELLNYGLKFRVYGMKKANEIMITNSFSVIDLFENVKPGFENWVNNDYVQSFNGPSIPDDLNELYTAFNVYYFLPTATVTLGEPQGSNFEISATVSTDLPGNYLYVWQYDNEGVWTDLTSITSNDSIVTNDQEELLNGGAKIRCKVLDATTQNLLTISNDIFVNPLKTLYDNIANNINTHWNLSNYVVYVNNAATVDNIAIDSTAWEKYFYWDAVAADPKVDFFDGESYKSYLVQTYLKKVEEVMNDEDLDVESDEEREALAETAAYLAVKEKWDYYLYDIYDPNWKSKTNKNAYPNYTFGDKNSEWVKDSYTSFHTNLSGDIDLLDYGLDDEGVDYSNFVRNVDKKVTAVEPGDENVDRKYDVHIKADVQAVSAAPIAIILQVQTSWQMFDLAHASSSQKNTPMTYTDELATLYDIKHALYDFVEEMHKKHSGNSILLGVTEVKHSGSTSMFNNNGVYYTNNYEALLSAISSWDIFGNCELVHYDNNTLVNAVDSLPINLDVWNDIYEGSVTYDEIQKDVIIIGGPTEDGSYNITLPWGTFAGDGVNAVYGIRVNDGTPRTTNIMSWLDYSGNKPATDVQPYNNEGNTYTREYIATTREAVFEALMEIAENDIRNKGTIIGQGDKYVDDFVINDKVEDEFEIDYTHDIVASIHNSDNEDEYEAIISFDKHTVTFHDVKNDTNITVGANFNTATDNNGATVKTVSFSTTQTYLIQDDDDDGDEYETITSVIPHELKIVENLDKTTDVSYNYGKVYNTKMANLDFRIVAREDYIGSNNVYTNIGKALVTYTHSDEIDGLQNYSVSAIDTPQVNVPIRYNTVDGSEEIIYVGESTNLKNLDTNKIVNEVQTLIRKYNQVNGVVSYSWTLSNGTTVELGESRVTNSVVENEVPFDYTFVGSEVGEFTHTLNVTFTPDDVDPNNNNMYGQVTKTPVDPKARDGTVKVIVVGGDETTNLLIKKRWLSPKPDSVTTLDVYLYADGERVTDDNDNPITYTLKEEDDWELTVYGLPVYDDYHRIDYTVVEEDLNIYVVDYRKKNIIVDEYSIAPTIHLKPSEDIKKNKVVNISYTLDGTSSTYSYVVTADMAKNTVSDIVMPALRVDNPDDFNFSVTSVTVENKQYQPPDFTVTESGGGVIINLNLLASNKLDRNKTLTINYLRDGQSGSFQWSTGNNVYNAGATIPVVSPVLEDGDYSIVSADLCDNKGNVQASFVNLTYDAGSAFISGQEVVPMLIISNSISVEFPNTGGNGGLSYILVGRTLMLIPFVYGCVYFIRKRKIKE